MSVIEKLDSVLEILNHSDAGPDEMLDAAKDLLRDHGPAIRQAMIDAERYRAVRAENEKLQAALRKIADWHGDFGPFPETNNAWRAMVVITAREAVLAIDKARATGEGEGNG